MRFPEFTEEWETKKLGEISSVSSGGTPSRANPLYWDGDIPWISTTLIDFNLIEKSEEYITQEGLENSSAKLFPIGTLLMAMYGQGKTRGKVAILNIEATTNQACGAIITNEEVLNSFFAFQNLVKRYDEIRDLSNQGSQENLSGGIIKGIKITFPKLSEQIKITSFLSLIDERIQTQNKIIEELKLLKNTLSKKIISGQLKFKDKNGNNFPEWVSKELAEVMSVPEKIKSKNIDKSRLLTVKLHLKGVSQNDNTNTLSLGATNYFIRKKGQFIYGKQNLFNGAFGIIPDEFDGFLSSGDVPALDIKHSKINTAYLIYFLGRVDFYKRLEDLAAGSGSKRIHETTLLGIKIDFPTIEEQHKIASFLLSIDGKIEIETNILQKLERQKTYFLANLFI
ncbi:restriction endonuclease subunit S [Elizabethkingia anophelis]|nr:restriction endonuclease subunit S [Elizabethkingia anophelis]MCT4225031.1 restriction endonuclease subunit S [Elizabethkingia anophelis]MCT4306622.1 restriction endonuclease subunit S [Elizabethkingia anophelis]